MITDREIKLLSITILFARYYDGDEKEAMRKAFNTVNKISDKLYNDIVKKTLRG